MATINNRPNGHRWIQFTGLDRRRYTLRLGKVSKKVAIEVQRRVETLLAVKLSGAVLDAGTAEWLSQTDGAIRERLVKLGLADPRATQVTLGDWIEQFLDEKTNVKKSTLGTYDKPKANLIDYFGADRLLSSITPGDAEAWRNWVASSSNKRDENRTSLAESTVRRRTGQAKQFFTAAVKRGLIPSNPFEELRSTVHANEARQHFVTRETIDAVIAAVPDAQWRAIIALARYGGLRMPSEMISLKWEDIDFAAGKMVLRSSKTAHHRSGGRRVCPLFPELRPYLEDL